jgi:hypothetical protein
MNGTDATCLESLRLGLENQIGRQTDSAASLPAPPENESTTINHISNPTVCHPAFLNPLSAASAKNGRIDVQTRATYLHVMYTRIR